VVGFTLELLSNLPRHLRLRLGRADCRAPPRPPCGLPAAGYLAPLGSGFCEERWLGLLEERRLPYIVVADRAAHLQLRQRRLRQPPHQAGD